MRAIGLLGAVAFAAVAPAAYAAPVISFAGGSGTIAPTLTVFENFDGYAPGTSVGTNTVATNGGARPAFGSTGNYGAVLRGGSYTVNFAAASVFSFVLGSLDRYNTLTLLLADSSSLVYSGGQIIGGGNPAFGDRAGPTTNGVVTFNANGGPKIVGATFASASNSFEFDNLAAGVPEPATWAMMIFGFGAVAGVMRHRRRAARACA